ncbi:MAG TPA: hypothetical protein VJV23_02085 [Candidatus Polarisedimenticolia bacterium]|nr:hypothetical protein [Candidatus Polarisedimenticolia bacterium]
MTPAGRLLATLQPAAAVLLGAAAFTGYLPALGVMEVGRHIVWGFAVALAAAFAHAMTLFYFAGIGVSLRQSVGGQAGGQECLEASARLRRRLAPWLGAALFTLMAAVILGGGSHTRSLPSWVHHAASLASLAANLPASFIARRAIAEQERWIARAQRLLERPASGG